MFSAVNLYQMGSLKAEIRGIQAAPQALHLATKDNQVQRLHLREGQLRIVK